MPPPAHARLGQHILRDTAVLERILAAANLTPASAVLEIGAGTGVLTERLVAAVPQGHVAALETNKW